MATITAAVPYSGGRNLFEDPRLTATTMSTNGGTVEDTRPSSGGPDGGSFFRRFYVVANTSSPVSMAMSGTGTSGIPFQAGDTLTMSAYIRKEANAGIAPAFRFDTTWYDVSGASLGAGSTPNLAPTTSWVRFAQSVVAPANTRFVQVRLIWTGAHAQHTGQAFDLAMAQAELGSLTEFTDNRTVNPLAILDYGFERGSRDVILEPLGSRYPTVFLRESQSRSGTLTMLVGSATAANDADALLSSVNRFHFQEPAASQDFHFIRAGRTSVAKVEGVNYWTVGVEFREVEPT